MSSPYDPWTADASTADPFAPASHTDIGITVEPPPDTHFGYPSPDGLSQDMPSTHPVHPDEYSIPPGLNLGSRGRSFNIPRPTQDGVHRTQSDLTGLHRYFGQSYPEGSAVEDDFSSGYASVPPSPAPSGGYPSPSLVVSASCHGVEPCATLLLPPAASFGRRHPSTSSFGHSEASGTAHAVDWDDGSDVGDAGGGSHEQPSSSPMVPWGNGQQLTVPGAFGAYRETRRGSFGSETSSSNASFNPNPQWNHGGPHGDPTVWDGQLTVPESYGQMRRGSFSGSETSSSAPFSPNPQWNYSGAHDHAPGSPMVPWGNGQQLTIPSPALYRDRRPSLSGSETSSNAPFSPNYQWDHPSPSFLSDHDDMRAHPVSASDADSQNFHQDMDRITRKSYPQFPGLHDFAPVPRATPAERSRTTSSSDTARPTGGADNQQEIDAITEDLRSSFPGFHDSAAVYNVAGPSHHNPTPSSSVAGPSLAHRKGRPGYRHLVATEASCKAAHARRKHKDRQGAFICDDCGRDFTAKHNLKNHKNSHDSVKNFECHACGASFGTLHVLKRHTNKCKKLQKLRGREGT